MRTTRLSHALAAGAFTLPDAGHVAVFRPRAGDDLSPLPRDRVTVVTGFRPDHDAFTAQGYAVARTAPDGAVAALVCLPRAKVMGRALLAAAARATLPGGPVIVDGDKTDGIDSALRDLRARGVAVGDPVAKAHGRIFAFAAGPDLSDWAAAPTRTADGFLTAPGTFSADGADRGSALLAAALPAKLPSRVADLGAGWGYLARAILARDGVAEVHLIEAEADALDCARVNIPDPRARFTWADAAAFHPDRPYGAVVCNPPFHTARTPDPGLGLAFITAAARMLTRDGTLWMVANRHLPYARPLAAAFREVEAIGTDPAFALWRATKPMAAPRS